jgi:predicted RND superfamily exporter protein
VKGSAANRDYAGAYARFVLRHRQAVMLLCLLFTALAAWHLDRINLRNDPDSLLPLSNPYIATNLYAELTYGMGNIMVWGIKAKDGDIYQPWFLEMVRALYRDVTALDYANADNFVGLASGKLRNIGVAKDGSLDFKRLLPSNGLSGDPQERQDQIAYLRRGLEKHLVLEPLLLYYQDAAGNKCELMDDQGRITNSSVAHVHSNCRAVGTFIIGDFENGLKDEYLDWYASVQAIMADYEARFGDRVEFFISGEPYFLAAMVQDLWDKAWLFAVSLIIVVAVLWYQFRHWACAILPLLGVGMTIVLTLGLMGYTEFKLTTMMVLTPMLLLAIGIGHSMQITRRFMQELHLHGDPEKAAEESIRHTIVPAFLSIGTDLHGFFAISFVDISFYKAYAYFGIFGMSTLLITTTTLIPLMMIGVPPTLHDHEDERPWEQSLARRIARLLTGPWKWLPALAVLAVLWVSAHYAELGRGTGALLAGEAGRVDPEVARIQDEFDIMPGAEKGIHYPRAAFKDHYLLGDIFGGDGSVKPIADLEALSTMMPGVITANLVIRSRAGVLPQCGLEAWSEDGERLKGPEVCFDPQEDPAQGIFNDAEVLAALAAFEDWLRSHPHIGFTASYAQFVRTLNMVLNTPEGELPQQHLNLYEVPSLEHLEANRYAYESAGELPDPDATIELYNGILANTAGPGELDTFVDTRNWDQGIIVGFVNTMVPALAHRTVVDIQNYLKEHRDDPGMDKLRIGLEDGERIQVRIGTGVGAITTDHTLEGRAAIGGFLGVTEATRDVAFDEWLHAPLMTSATVFAMTAIMFRSWLIAGILISLCFITLMSQYGLAGYMTSIGEWSANLAFHVQVALSIAMGLGIDYSVYMVSRLREEMQANNGNWNEALRETLTGTGSAVLISVAVLLSSLIPLMNTELANTWSVSLYIGEALILDVLTALMFLPLLMYWFKPRYIFQR